MALRGVAKGVCVVREGCDRWAPKSWERAGCRRGWTSEAGKAMKLFVGSSAAPGPAAAPAPSAGRRVWRPGAVVVLVLGLGMGTAACLGGGGSAREAGSASLVRDGLASGTYPYVVACQIFTGAGVRAIAGRAADPTSVQGKYGVGFPRTAPQDKAFTSSCTRSPRKDGASVLSDVYDVSINQYPSTTMIKRLIKDPPKLRGSQIRVPGLADRFGAGAILNRGLLGGSQILTFFYQNKVVNVGVTLVPGKQENPQTKVIKLGERVLRRLRADVGTSGFVMGPASGRLARFRYFPPCNLLTPTGVRAAFRGLTVDTASISFTYGEGLTRNKLAEEAIAEEGGGARVVYNDLNGHCGYSVTGVGGSPFHVILSTDQAFDRSAATREELSYFYRHNTTDDKIRGAGQAAKIATLKSEFNEKFYPELWIRYPHILVRVALSDFKGTKAQRMGYLRKIAKQLPARLP